MIKEDSLRFLLSKQGNMRSLCIASFMQSSASGIWQVSIPYICKRFDGTDTQLGMCMSLWFVSYLVGCLAFGPFLNRFNPKHTVITGAGLNVLASIVLLLIVISAGNGVCPFEPITALILLSAVSGAFTSLFWPPIMGWVSTGYEGATLSKRLGLFSVSWASGSLTTPYFAGLMVEHSSVLPVIAQLVFMTLSLSAIFWTKNPGISHSNSPSEASLPDDTILTLLPKFRWMSRIALLCAFVCAGLARTQLAVLFKFELLFSETNYGSAMLGMSIAIFIIFTITGRVNTWHYKLWPFIASQVALLISMVFILISSSLAVLIAAAVMIGIGQAFIYTSHIYYGVSGGKNRSGRMAIHETALALGYAFGGMTGGIISDKIGRYSPYTFGFVVVAVGMCIQAVIWFKGTKAPMTKQDIAA